MTSDEVSAVTGLDTREVARVESPVFKYPTSFIALGDTFRCQIGRFELGEWSCEERDASTGAVRRHSGVDKFFRLLAYGRTWDEALANLRRKAAEPNP